MNIHEVQAKTILRKHKKIDSWFLSRYGMNLYRGCAHNCAYCDGRAEQYRVAGTFGEDIEVKINAPQILERELDPARKRVPFVKGFVFCGGGVSDAYQPVEREYNITRRALELLYKFDFSVHVLTKSLLVKRDADLLQKINRQNRAIVSMSFSSMDDSISAVFEPGVASPSKRLELLKFFKARGIACGMYLMPVIPYVTDIPVMLDQSVKRAKEAGLDFVVFGGLTLKEGRQKEHFFRVLEEYDPSLSYGYDLLYRGDKYGMAATEYYDSVNHLFYEVVKHYNMPYRVPSRLYKHVIPENDYVVVRLEHMDYRCRLEGKKSPYGYAAYNLSKVKESIGDMRFHLKSIKGVGEKTARAVRRILDDYHSG